MRYRLIEAKDLEGLEREVNAALADGWRPQGGVCVANSEQTYNWWYYQALVFDDRTADEP